MISELTTFNHLRCSSSLTALGAGTGYLKLTQRGTDETPHYLNFGGYVDNLPEFSFLQITHKCDYTSQLPSARHYNLLLM